MEKEHIYNASNPDGTLNAVIRWNIGGVDLVVDGKRKANALHFHGYRSATLANQRQLNQTVSCLLSLLTPDTLKDGLKWVISCFPWTREVQTLAKYKGETTNAEGTQIKWYAVFSEEKLTVSLSGANFKLINIRASYTTPPTQEQMQGILTDVQRLLTLPLNEALQNIRLLFRSGKYECFKRPEPQPKREKPQPKPKQDKPKRKKQPKPKQEKPKREKTEPKPKQEKPKREKPKPKQEKPKREKPKPKQEKPKREKPKPKQDKPKREKQPKQQKDGLARRGRSRDFDTDVILVRYFDPYAFSDSFKKRNTAIHFNQNGEPLDVKLNYDRAVKKGIYKGEKYNYYAQIRPYLNDIESWQRIEDDGEMKKKMEIYASSSIIDFVFEDNTTEEKEYAPQISWDQWEIMMMAEEQERKNNKTTITTDGTEKERTENN